MTTNPHRIGPLVWVPPLTSFILPGQLPGGSKYATRFDPVRKMMVPRGRKNPTYPADPFAKKWLPSAFQEWIDNLETFQHPGGTLHPPKDAFVGPVVVEVYPTHKDRRPRDADNWLAALFNFLQLRRARVGRRRIPLPGTGWVRDDSQLIPVVHPAQLDPKNPHAEIHLYRPAE